MKDIPFFTTENGAASLSLQQIPYRHCAYVTIRASQSLPALVEDCVGFCRACGAEKVYACGHEELAHYPLHTALWRMTGSRESLPETDAALFPVQAQTMQQWRQLYNEAMAQVDNAAYLTPRDAEELLRAGEAYFVHRGDTLLGIGSVSGETLKSVASLIPGCGGEVVAALAHAMTGDRITLEVASTNHRAIRLYERLGMLAVGEVSRWYRIF